MGKTKSLFDSIADESLDAAMSVRHHEGQFNCFAFRSNEQAAEKAQEYRESGKYRYAVQITSVWEHYRRCCQEENLTSIPEYEFHDHSINGILGHINANQPSVFGAMEQRRKRLWKGEARSLFDPGMTVLFTNHAQATRWHRTHATRIWHHPNFCPLIDKDHESMKAALTLSQIVFDEPENDLLILIVSEQLKVWTASFKRRHPGWKDKVWKERFNLYQLEARLKEIPGNHSFEHIDELMRVDLGQLEPFDVDYESIPFGCDRGGKGIYSTHHGKRFFLGPQQWMADCKARLTFLTTESLVSRVLLRVHQKLHKNLHLLELHPKCAFLPIAVPLVIDKRAAKGTHKITELVLERLANPNAIVIANGTKCSDPRVKTFQRAKGVNRLEHNDICIIPTFLAADHYAELNVVGQWLNLPNVITDFYADQIHQAVGRNQGFRKTDKGSVAVIVSPRLKRDKAFSRCFANGGRVKFRNAA
jgi:hypothetical protein